MEIAELLDKAKEITGSDTETAKRIGARQQHISLARSGDRGLTDYQIAQLAEIIGQRWYDVALPYKAERAKTPEEKEFWMGKLSALLRNGAAPAMIAVGLVILKVAGLKLGVLDGQNLAYYAGFLMTSELSDIRPHYAFYTVAFLEKRDPSLHPFLLPFSAAIVHVKSRVFICWLRFYKDGRVVFNIAGNLKHLSAFSSANRQLYL